MDSNFRDVEKLYCHYFDIGSYERAVECARDLIRARPESWEGYKNLACALRERDFQYVGRDDIPIEFFKEAYNSAKLAVKYGPEEAGSWCILGKMARALGKLDESRGAHLKAISLDNNCWLCWTALAQCVVGDKGFRPTLEMEGELQEYFEQSFKVYRQEDRDFWLIWGYIWECFNDVAKAKEFYLREINANPCNAMAANNIGEIVLAAGDKEDADKWFRKALEIDPTNKRFRWNLARKAHSPLVQRWREA